MVETIRVVIDLRKGQTPRVEAIATTHDGDKFAADGEDIGQALGRLSRKLPEGMTLFEEPDFYRDPVPAGAD